MRKRGKRVFSSKRGGLLDASRAAARKAEKPKRGGFRR